MEGAGSIILNTLVYEVEHLQGIMPEPPRTIPDELRAAYTLGGEIPVYDWYRNDSVEPHTVHWTNSYIQGFCDHFTFDKIENNALRGETYPGASLLHVTACKKYPVRGKDVAVIGSETPWIEAILMNAGAKSVTTVEYNTPICHHPVLKTMSYVDFCASSAKYDAIFSYSSIEHSGLGRYGDPLNPNGDIETMERVYASLKDGGYCFLGVPVGKDHLVWNVHRIYGETRLKLMFLDKFEEVEWIGCDKNFVKTCPVPLGNPDCSIQPIIVLRRE
jgi:hypothetical protein